MRRSAGRSIDVARELQAIHGLFEDAQHEKSLMPDSNAAWAGTFACDHEVVGSLPNLRQIIAGEETIVLGIDRTHNPTAESGAVEVPVSAHHFMVPTHGVGGARLHPAGDARRRLIRAKTGHSTSMRRRGVAT